MKNKRGVITKRQQVILQKLKDDKTVSVEILARKLNVSPLTIRRDLERFEKQGFVKRFYGGASLIEGTIAEDPSNKLGAASEGDDTALYRRIVAQRAAELVEDGDTIFINSSRTALALLDYITHKRVTIITNNGNALNVPHDPMVSIILTGGEISSGKYSLVGDFALSTIKKMQADKCFIGVSGITADGRISTAVLQETMINTLMLEHTKGDAVILADHTKIGALNNFIIADVKQITHIVTDSLADPVVLSALPADVTVLQGIVPA